MGLEQFKAAYEALPESIHDRENIVDFVAGVAVSYMSVEEAMQVLLLAAAKVAEYGEELQRDKDECTCDSRAAKRAAEETKH
jgi:hypothetical protein